MNFDVSKYLNEHDLTDPVTAILLWTTVQGTLTEKEVELAKASKEDTDLIRIVAGTNLAFPGGVKAAIQDECEDNIAIEFMALEDRNQYFEKRNGGNHGQK